MAFLDTYERKARLTPGLLAFAPVAFVLATLGYKRFPAVAIALGVLLAAGGSYALSLFVAHVGRRAQNQLWFKWGGSPTTKFLRTREVTTNPIQRDAWRMAIERGTGVTLLSVASEAANPTDADNTIQVAVDQMRSLGQDARFPLIKAENIQYGFERNLFGFRWIGRLISLTCVAILVGVVIANRSGHPKTFSDGALVSGAIIDLLFLLAWLLIPSADRAKGAAERYGRQLLQAVVTLGRQAPPGSVASDDPASSGDAR